MAISFTCISFSSFIETGLRTPLSDFLIISTQGLENNIEMVYLMTESGLATILEGMGYQAFWGPRSRSLGSDIHLMLTENAN